MEYPKWKENGKIKLAIIVGTRPEIIRLAAVIKKCRKYFDTQLWHTGQNYDYTLNGIFFRDLGLADPDLYLDAVGDDLGATMGNIIDRSYKAMVATAPQAVVIPTPAFPLSAQSGSTFRFSTWKPETVVRTNACRKRLIGG